MRVSIPGRQSTRIQIKVAQLLTRGQSLALEIDCKAVLYQLCQSRSEQQ